MTITNAVILRIDQLLEENGMTKRQLRIKGGLAQGTLASIYKQIAKGVSLSTVHSIARGFGMTMSKFLDDEVFVHLDID